MPMAAPFATPAEADPALLRLVLRRAAEAAAAAAEPRTRWRKGKGASHTRTGAALGQDEETHRG